MTSLDVQILMLINGWSTPWLDSWFRFVTTLGGFEFVLVFNVLLSVVLISYRQYRHVALLVLGVGGAALLNQVLKYAFERARPDLWEQLVTETSYSFPSGHAMVSLALAACLVIMVWRQSWRWLAVGLAGLYVIMIGFSRLYLGVHYPTDVVAGWVFSGLWVVVASNAVYLGFARRR